MYSQYVFLAPSTVLALCYFSPNGPKKGLFKQIRSKDRERDIAGIKNATWDLTLIHQWLGMVRGQRTDNTIYLIRRGAVHCAPTVGKERFNLSQRWTAINRPL